MKKPSLFSRLPGHDSIKREVYSAKKTLLEYLTPDMVKKVYKDANNLGKDSKGKPIQPDDVASQDNSAIINALAGIKVMTDPSTGKLIIVTDDPDAVNIRSEADASKIAAMASAAKSVEDTKSTSSNTTTQLSANQQNATKQKAEQGTVRESMYRLGSAYDIFNTDSEEKKEEDPKEEVEEEVEEVEEEESEKLESDDPEEEEEEEHKKHEESETKEEEAEEHENTVVMADPLAGIDNFFTALQQPAYNYEPDEMLAQVRTAQANVGAPLVPVTLHSGENLLPAQQPMPAKVVGSVPQLNITAPLPDSDIIDMGGTKSMKLLLQLEL